MDTEGIDIGHAPHGIEHERRLKCLRPRERARRGVGRADWNRLPAGNVRIAEQVVIEIPAITTKRPGELVKLALRGPGQVLNRPSERSMLNSGVTSAICGNIAISSAIPMSTLLPGNRSRATA